MAQDRRDRVTAGVPIVIVTNEKRQSLIDRAREAGADVVLVKPTPPEDLLREIDRLTHRPAPAPPTIETRSAERSAGARRMAKAKTHSRFSTTTPPASPPALTCPSCDAPLAYDHSHIGGVSDLHSEQWDYFACSQCGAFRYRQRTRKLQRLSDEEQQWVMQRKE